ncbi:MAG: ABC transporter ATP-binding protein [Pirellulaceae bacterium]|nr:ABC transporter ATP-binding protein [Pirellulaceae bacterium]
MITIRRLHRFFGTTRAVDDISFEVQRGQIFGYIGPNGAGKTTSMRILATLDLPTAGDALVDGLSVVNDPDRVRRRLGFMPDYFGTYNNVDCQEYLDFFARAYGLMGAARNRAVRHVMSFTGLDVLAAKPIQGLSKGMKQRLCLGRALIHDPAVLILDEPAAGLDPRARIELRQMIGQLGADGKTVLISSHILTELAEMCDTVAILERGKLLAVGSVDEIQRGSRTQGKGQDASLQTVVSMRVLSNAEGLVQWLESRDANCQLRVDGDVIAVIREDDTEADADLLRDIIQAGFRIVQFGSRQQSLEDVFLEVTKGQVQ